MMGWREIMGVRTTEKHPHNPQNYLVTNSSEHRPVRINPPVPPVRPIGVEWQAFVTRGLPPKAHPGERAEAVAYQRRLVEWLDDNPASSAPDRCAECCGVDAPGAALVPFGVGPHVWLHTDCWPVWRDKRVEQARVALAGQGIMEDPYAGPPPKVIPWLREAPKEADDAPPF